MEKINNRKFAITSNELGHLGALVERFQKKFEELNYGFYSADNLDLDEKLALKIIEGMSDWQWQHNKGVRLAGDIHIRVELYELHELHKRIEECMENIDW